jgi:hypothetical protein
VTFNTVEEKILAVSNIKNVTIMTKKNNKLFNKKLRNFETTNYWFDYLSNSDFKQKFLGAVVYEKEIKQYIGSVVHFNGTVLKTEYETTLRRKRQTRPNLPLECKNLPVYKNWLDERKTAPVQNQYGCGMIDEHWINCFKHWMNL